MNDKTIAPKFYGKHYATAAGPEQLDKACIYLDMAMRAEADPNATEKKLEMALSSACKAELAGFGGAA